MVGDLNRDSLHFTLLRIDISQRFIELQKRLHVVIPRICSKRLDKIQYFFSNLINGFGAIDWSFEIIWVRRYEASRKHLMNRLSANCFAGIRLITLAVMPGKEFHHRRNPAEWIRCLGPFVSWPQTQQSE